MAQEEGSQAVVGEEEAEDSAVVSVSRSEEEQDDCAVDSWESPPNAECAVIIADPETFQLRSGPNLLGNALLAGGLVTWAFFTFSTVDSDIWRGWTTEETLLRLLPDAWRAYESSLEVDPVAVKAFITAVSYFLGDWLAQGVANRNDAPDDPFGWLAVDRTRLLRGLAIGAPLGVLAHYYYGLNDELLGDWPFLAKILVDQTVYLFTYNSAYYLGTGVLGGKSPQAALDDYSTKWKALLTAGWKLWPIVGIITYTIIPLRHRLLWVDAIEILYSALLSSISNESGEGGGGGTGGGASSSSSPAAAAAAE